MKNHFYVIVLFEFPCDTDHDSDAKMRIYKSNTFQLINCFFDQNFMEI